MSDVFPPLWKAMLRALVVLLIDAVVLLLLSELMERFTLDGPRAALVTAAIVGLLNALVWPLLARLTLPLSVLTLGLGAIVLNAVLVAFAIELVPGAHIDGIPEAIAIALGLSVLTALISALLAIGDDQSWHRNVVRRQLRRRGDYTASDVPGVLFLEIDGLAHPVLGRAMRAGVAPNLARWVESGSHELNLWRTDTSSQTGACQAGLLHGNNDDMPAFRWWEKERGKPIVTNHPRDAEELERRHSDGRGLLHADGASRANILSGDAPHSMLTMSTVLRRRKPLGRDYAAYFAQPYAAFKTLSSAIAEMARERFWATRSRRRDVRPRIERSRTYAAVRAWATVVQLDLQVAAVVADVLAGRPVIYTTFLAYDEVAHHSGIERPDTLATLARVDRAIGLIAKMVAAAPRPYKLVVLSDHGQSQGATFLQRFGKTLEEVVAEACETTPERVHAASGGEDEAASYMGATLTELRRDDTVTARAVRAATERRTDDGVVAGPAHGAEQAEPVGDEPPELSVMASGCLGLISFPREPGRVSAERLEALHPGLLDTLRAHPGIGFVMVRSEHSGAVVLGAEGSHRLADGAVEGTDPLAVFGPAAAANLKRTDGFAHCPDILVNSSYDPATEEVHAFEELVGSHGGLGGPQAEPFVCHPADLRWPGEEVVGAERVHRVFRAWLAELGQSAYASPSSSEPPGSSTRTDTSGASEPS